MNIVFLDFDGVVNILMFTPDSDRPKYNYPEDGTVNSYQAIRWIEKLCRDASACIVISSSWRDDVDCAEVLYNSGLSRDILIYGTTGYIQNERHAEIQSWIDACTDEISNFVIIDDIADMGSLQDKAVVCGMTRGFGLIEYNLAMGILKNK